MTLDEIGVKHATDKSSMHHHYLGLYELLFSRWKRNDPINILEIGIQFGNSMRTWRDYFPNAHIVGIDSVDNGVQPDGFSIIIGDAYEHTIFTRLPEKTFFDIIIDDGDHDVRHQQWFLEHYSYLLSSNGFLIVEDVLGKAEISLLAKSLPVNWNYVAIDMTEGDSLMPSRLFIVTRRQSAPVSEETPQSASPVSPPVGSYQPPL